MTPSRVRRFWVCGALFVALALPISVPAASLSPNSYFLIPNSWLSAQLLGVGGAVDAFFKLTATLTDQFLASLIVTNIHRPVPTIEESLFAIEPGGSLPVRLAAVTTTSQAALFGDTGSVITAPPARIGSEPARVAGGPVLDTLTSIANLNAAVANLQFQVSSLNKPIAVTTNWAQTSLQPVLPQLLKNLTNPIVEGSLTMVDGTLSLSATQGSISITTGTLTVGGFSVANTNGSTTVSLTGAGQFDTLKVATGTLPSGALFTVGTSTTIFNVLSSGNVGIGTSVPSSTLHVIGTGIFTTVSSTGLIFTNATGTTLALTGLTAGSVPFAGTGGILSQSNANLFWDNTNLRLGIGTAAPAARLSVAGGVAADSLTLGSSSAAVLTAQAGANGYLNISGGLGTGGLDSSLPALRLSPYGNFTNVGSIQAGETLLTRGGTLGTVTSYSVCACASNSHGDVGDLNGDGKIDIVTSQLGSSTLVILFNNGSGVFTSSSTLAVGAGPLSAAVGDFNGDGKNDVVASNNSSNPRITIFMNNGNGTFTTSTYAGTVGSDVIAKDLNGDGRADVAASGGSTGVSVFLNAGSGVFASEVIYGASSTDARKLAAADLNGDGKSDIVTSNGGDFTVSVLLNNGNGTFASAVTYPVGSSNVANQVALGDLNGDGYADIAEVNNAGGATEFSVLLNNGNGTFGTATVYSHGASDARGLAMGDMNGDGKLDIVVGGGGASIIPNNGDGTFGAARFFSGGSGFTRSTRLADLNGDGKLDVVSMHGGTAPHTAEVFLTVPQAIFFAQASSGFVGIGTSTPLNTLHLWAPTTTALTFDNTGLSGGRRLDFRLGSLASGTFDIFDFTSSTSRLSITAAGLLGIGTAQPSSTLHVIGNLTVSSSVAIVSSTDAALHVIGGGAVGGGLEARILVRNATSTYYSSLVAGNANLDTYSYLISGASSTGIMPALVFSHDMRFGTSPNTFGSSFSEKMRITSGGNVGIGTTAPTSTLSVSGRVAIGSSYAGSFGAPTNGLIVEGNVGIGTAQPSSTLHLVGANTSTLSLMNTLSGGKRYDLRVGEVASGTLDIFDFTSSTSRFSIASSGNIGIGVGTSSPITQLHVAGATPRLVATIATDRDEGGIDPPNSAGIDHTSLYIQGRYAYTINTVSSTLQVFDVSDPASPAFISSSSISASPTAISVQGKYAYVGTGCASVVVLDISNPRAPVTVGTSSNTACARDIYVQGKYVYILSILGGGFLRIFDVSDPTTPRQVESFNNGLNVSALSLQGRYAYGTAHNTTSSKLDIYDVSNPTAISRVFTSSTAAFGAIAVQGRYAYGADNLGTFRVTDISNPASPVVAGSVSGVGGSPQIPYVQGRYAYVTSNASNTLSVVDISSPSSPRVVSVASTENLPGKPVVQGRYLYLKNRGSSTIQIYDLGGSYVQQLEGGGIEASTLGVRNNFQVFNDADIGGGLTVGRGANITGPFSISAAASTTSFFSVNQNGLVGINTATPSFPLHVFGVPVQSVTSTLVLLGNNLLSGGSASGTFLGANPTSTFNGDFLNFQVNSSTQFLVSGGGLVGIGTGRPSSTLHLFGTSTSTFSIDNSGLSGGKRLDFRLGAVASGTFDIFDFTSSTSRLSISAAGLVGIGTTQPSSTLHVIGNLQVSVTSTLAGRVLIGTSTASAINGATSTLTVCALSNCTKPAATTSTDVVAFFASTDGTTTGASIIARGTITSGQADIGEYVAVVGSDSDYEAGDLLSAATSSPERFQKSSSQYDPYLAGVVTKTAGLIAGGGADNHGNTVITLAGRVPVKVSLENGAIHIGDRITASSKPGIGMKATDPGQVVGMALEEFSISPSTSSGQATSSDVIAQIMVFVNPHWALGSIEYQVSGITYQASSTATSTLQPGSGQATSTGSGQAGILDQFTSAIKGALQKLGLLIQDGIARVRELFAEKITTNQLCLDDVCVTKDQLSALLGTTSIAPAPAPATTSEPAPSSTEATGSESVPATSTATSTPADAGSATTTPSSAEPIPLPDEPAAATTTEPVSQPEPAPEATPSATEEPVPAPEPAAPPEPAPSEEPPPPTGA